MFQLTKLLGAALIAAILSACGGGSGGGGGSSQPVANQDPQGFWTGTSSAGYNIGSVVLENGEFYSMFSQNGIAYGIDYGTGTVSGTNISGSVQEFYIPTNQVYTGTISATFAPKATLQGSTSYNNGVTTTFNTTYNASYDTPASLSTITGNYSGNYYTPNTTVNLSISSNGVTSGYFTTNGSRTCNISGTVTPRPSGKNVYNVTLTFTDNAGTCVPGTGAESGVGVLNVVNGVTYLYTAGLNAGQTNGFFWIGQKQ